METPQNPTKMQRTSLRVPGVQIHAKQATEPQVREEGKVLTLGYRTGLNFSPTASSQKA